MIDYIINLSIKNKLVVGLFVIALIGWGIYSFKQIPMDAVPDITNNQVQIITQSPALATQEVEQFITFPIELAMANLPQVVEIRSISRFGISVVTVVFEEDADVYRCRQLISEQLAIAEADIPEAYGTPELGPISTGLGEVYQYVLHTEPEYDSVYSAMDLREINDWIVKRQLAGIPGVIEISGWGGKLKQYEVAVNPDKLKAQHVTMAEVFAAIEQNNENTGGSYIEKASTTYFVRGEGMVGSLEDIQKIVVKTVAGLPILVRDVAEVRFGHATRYGAMTWNGHGEVVGGQTLMLKGENSLEVVTAVKERVETIKTSLPPGVVLEPFIDRSVMIDRAMGTVTENLLLGGLIVIFVLVFLLGNFRGGLIVASTIPLSMLFALGMMNALGVSANLMSLGALDFGIIVDGAVIIVESVVFYWGRHMANRDEISVAKRDEIAAKSSSKMMKSAFFGQLIILIVFLPILTLEGIEGKMFRPMALTVGFAMIGAILLSLTYIPMMSALLIKPGKKKGTSFSDKITAFLHNTFEPMLRLVMKARIPVLVGAGVVLIGTFFVFGRLGGEFIPVLEEGDFAIHQILPPGSSLEQGVEVSTKIQTILLEKFPEVEHVVVKMGTAEIPTDPMPMEVGDVMVKMKPKSEWTSAKTKEEMFARIAEELSVIPGLAFEFSQPVQMRFNELMTGVRQDIAVKIYGENLDVLYREAKKAERIIRQIDGVGDLQVEQVTGLSQIVVRYNRDRVAQYGLNIADLNDAVQTGFAGSKAGVVFENERRFDLVVRLEPNARKDMEDIQNLFIPLPNGTQIPLKEVAQIQKERGPAQISRENTRRRITIGINARGRDVESLITEINERLGKELTLPPGYSIEYGGAFENLKSAKKRLGIVVPIALLLIFLLVFLALKSLKQSLIIFMAVPFAAVGGVLALWMRGMPFSISAGVGFIVLSGVAVLNGLVLISSLNELKEGGMTDLSERILTGTKSRLRPILLTASTDILGFLPMALSSSGGAEVQRPLATVVVGGLISATLLTLFVIPILYSLMEKQHFSLRPKSVAVMVAVLACIGFGGPVFGQSQPTDSLTMEEAVALALKNHPSLKEADLRVDQQTILRKTAVDLERTSADLTYGQINSSNLDYQVQVNQGFAFPTYYAARGRLQDEQIKRSQLARELNALELEAAVRQRYTNLAFQVQMLQLAEEWEAEYRNFATIAQKRFAAGETNILEKTTGETRMREREWKVKEARSRMRGAQNLLGVFLQTDQPPVNKEPLYEPDEAVGVILQKEETAQLKWYQQNIQVQDQAHTVAKNQALPGFSLGYFNQQIDGEGGLNGFQVGLQVPLFFRAEKARIQSAALSTEIAKAEYDHQKKQFDLALGEAGVQYMAAMEQLAYYQTGGLENARELAEFARISYQEGEIGYVEYIANTDQAFEIRKGYLEALYEVNLAIIQVQFLSNNFSIK